MLHMCRHHHRSVIIIINHHHHHHRSILHHQGRVVRPRLSSLLRVRLRKETPPDLNKAFLERAAKYDIPSLAAAACTGADHSGPSLLGGGGGNKELDWEAVLAASSRGGRLGGNLKGDVKDAFHRLVRLSSQLAGEEGALDNAAAILYEIAASNDAANRRQDYEKMIQWSVKDSTWLQACTWAETVAKWYQERSSAGPRGASSSSSSLSEPWGYNLPFNNGLANVPELEFSDKEDADEGEAHADHPCYGMDHLDDEIIPSWPTPTMDSGVAARGIDIVDGANLLMRCENHIATGGSVGFAPNDLAKSVLDIVGKTTQEIELQTRLFDLLGAEGFELIMWIIENRNAIGKIRPKDLKARPPTTSSASSSEPPPRPSGRAPTVGPTVTIKTAEEIRQEKERRKGER